MTDLEIKVSKSVDSTEHGQDEYDPYASSVIVEPAVSVVSETLAPEFFKQSTDSLPATDLYRFHPTHSVRLDPPSGKYDFRADARVFIGNLASEKTTKDEIASIFVKYGNILEVSLQSSYGFVQYETPEACLDAIQHETGTVIGGKKIDCKQAIDKRSKDGRNPKTRQQRRSRSPRPRSRSPRRPSNEMPQRFRIPQVQIVVLENVDRRHISHMENMLIRAGFTVENMFLGPKMSFKTCAQQLQREGVKALVILERFFERDGTCGVQLFGQNGVEDYRDIPTDQALAVLNRIKSPLQNIAQALTTLANSGGADPQTLLMLANAIQTGAPLPALPIMQVSQMPIQPIQPMQSVLPLAPMVPPVQQQPITNIHSLLNSMTPQSAPPASNPSVTEILNKLKDLQQSTKQAQPQSANLLGLFNKS